MPRPDVQVMQTNIAAVYALALRSDISAGKRWYPMAHAIVCEWAEFHGRSIANVASIIAAISPQCAWERNLIIADDVLNHRPASIGGAIHSFLRIAERMRDDRSGNPAAYFKIGCKVLSFAANLAGNFDIVTVDTHGAQIALNDPAGNLRVDTWTRYEPVARAYVQAAHALKVKPAHLQAITWLTWKRLYPHKQNQRRAF